MREHAQLDLRVVRGEKHAPRGRDERAAERKKRLLGSFSRRLAMTLDAAPDRLEVGVRTRQAPSRRARVVPLAPQTPERSIAVACAVLLLVHRDVRRARRRRARRGSMSQHQADQGVRVFVTRQSAKHLVARAVVRESVVASRFHGRRLLQTQRHEQSLRHLRGRGQVQPRAVRVGHRRGVRFAFDRLNLFPEMRHEPPRIRNVEPDPGVFHHAEQSRDAALTQRGPREAGEQVRVSAQTRVVRRRAPERLNERRRRSQVAPKF